MNLVVDQYISGIYSIVNIVTGVQYIGQSSHMQKRWYEHLRKLRLGTHYNKHLQRAFLKYGEKMFSFRVLEENIPAELLTAQEQFWHDQCVRSGIKTYNHGDFLDNPFRGQHHTPETLAKLCRPRSEKTKQILSAQRLGRRLTESWKENIRKGCLGINTKTHCPQGHEKTPENTYAKSTCRACTLAASKRQKLLQRIARNGHS